MSVKAKVEAIIYATEEPVTLNQLASLLADAVLVEIRADEENRMALNEIISDGPPVAIDEDDEGTEPVVDDAEISSRSD